MSHRQILLAGALAFGLCGSAMAQDGCDSAGTVGSGGSAATDSTSATTLGTGAVCNDADGTSKTIGSGGSAAAVDGKADSHTNVVANPVKLQSMSHAKAQDGGEWSKSKTKTSVADDGLASTTRTMSHVPGERPTMSTSTSDVDLSGSEPAGSGTAATTGGSCPPGQAKQGAC